MTLLDHLTDRIVGGYRLDRRVGPSGAHGLIYEATDLFSGKERAAIKVLRADTQEEVENFQTEAEIYSSLDHDHILRCRDYWYDGRHKRFFLATDYLPGGSLRERLNKQQNFNERLELANRIIRQLAGALHQAHQRRIYHLDIKPVPSENLIRRIRSRRENRIMIETDGDLLQTSARLYVGLLSFA